jgi:hypothetical protein
MRKLGISDVIGVSINAAIIVIFLKLKSQDNDFNFVNDIRDVCLNFEEDVFMSLFDIYQIMKLALRLRPGGPLILKKVLEYRNRLGIVCEDG